MAINCYRPQDDAIHRPLFYVPGGDSVSWGRLHFLAAVIAYAYVDNRAVAELYFRPEPEPELSEIRFPGTGTGTFVQFRLDPEPEPELFLKI